MTLTSCRRAHIRNIVTCVQVLNFRQQENNNNVNMCVLHTVCNATENR